MYLNRFKITTVALMATLFSFCFTQDVVLSLDGSNLNYESSENIAGFQFSVEGATIVTASGGSAEEYGFMISNSS